MRSGQPIVGIKLAAFLSLIHHIYSGSPTPRFKVYTYLDMSHCRPVPKTHLCHNYNRILPQHRSSDFASESAPKKHKKINPTRSDYPDEDQVPVHRLSCNHPAQEICTTLCPPKSSVPTIAPTCLLIWLMRRG